MTELTDSEYIKQVAEEWIHDDRNRLMLISDRLRGMEDKTVKTKVLETPKEVNIHLPDDSRDYRKDIWIGVFMSNYPNYQRAAACELADEALKGFDKRFAGGVA